jgi:hypothetical protein
MSGKRSDQHNIDPAEGSSSDHKWRGEGRSGDEHVENEQKRNFQESRRDSKIPKSGQNPAERDLREKEAGEDESKSDDDRVDEASRESFPASDPPSY